MDGQSGPLIPEGLPVGLFFAIVILVLTFVLAWSARHHERSHAEIHGLDFLDADAHDHHDRADHG